MSAAAEKIGREIGASGPMPFSRFMEIALYDADCGYYMGQGEVFGRAGDFYTLEQLQPVYGRILAWVVRKHAVECGEGFRFVEWGAGRAELRPFLEEYGYASVDRRGGEAPERFSGIVFSNELFDALPVDVARRRGGEWIEMRVAAGSGRFEWVEHERLQGEWAEYARRAGAFIEEEEAWVELPVRVDETLGEMDERLEQGAIIAVDYGYTERELRRFPAGTLMSYRKHTATEAVLENAGEQDITAHVPLTYLMERAAARGWAGGRLTSLSGWVLEECGEAGLGAAIDAETEAERVRLRLQLKTIIAGMGESFRVAAWSKGGTK